MALEAPSPRLQALRLLRGEYPAFESGSVWLIGAGPGDPGLLTLDALAGLLQADVVVHDALIDARLLALARPEAQRQFAGKRGGKPSVAQEAICEQLIGFARQGLKVVRLKGGDPFIFGRGGEEMLALAEARIPFRVIPGMTAGLAGLAAAWIPATMRHVNQAVILVTGHAPDDPAGVDWTALARTGQPLILYMASKNLEAIAATLMRGGLPATTPAAVIASATLDSQKIIESTLAQVARAARQLEATAPSFVIIGEIVGVRQRLRDITAGLTQGEALATATVTDPRP